MASVHPLPFHERLWASAFHSPPHVVYSCLNQPADDGLQVSIEILYLQPALTRISSSTNARFIESLDSKYKSSVDRVQDSRRDNSDDEDEDALFAELEAEVENADSAALRDKGVKEMQAQLRRFSSFPFSWTARLISVRIYGIGWKRSKTCSRLGMDNTQKSRTRKRL